MTDQNTQTSTSVRDYGQVTFQLDSKIPADAVSERQGGNGKMLSYLETQYVIDRLNKVIGIGNWSYKAKPLKVWEGIMQDRNGHDIFAVSYTAMVELQVALGTARTLFEEVGYGDGSDKSHPGKPHELATKEAVSDGLKRCAKNLGMSMGLALYDKTRVNVEEAVQMAAPAPRAASPVKAAKPFSASIPPKATSAPAAPVTPYDLILRQGKVLIGMKKATPESLDKALMDSFGVSDVRQLTMDQATAHAASLTAQARA